jgi:hypothetical protein
MDTLECSGKRGGVQVKAIEAVEAVVEVVEMNTVQTGSEYLLVHIK